MRRAVIVLIVAAFPTCLAEQILAGEWEHVIGDFETAECLEKWEAGKGGGATAIELSPEHATRGEHSCKVVFSGKRYPYTSLAFSPQQQEKLNWEAYEHYEFDVYNPSDKQAMLNWMVFDVEGARVDRWVRKIPPKKNFHARLSIRSMRDHVNLARVKSIAFGVSRPKEPVTFFIDNIRLTSSIEPIPPLEKYPNLVVTADMIRLEGDPPQEERPATVSVRVANTGAKPVSGAEISFIYNGKCLSTVERDFEPRSEEVFEVQIRQVQGEVPEVVSRLRFLLVRADPGGLVKEAREDDNSAACYLSLVGRKHPYLFFTAEDVPELREKFKRAPYDKWWDSVRNSNDMRSLAFTYAITGDKKYAEQAKALLLKAGLPIRSSLRAGKPYWYYGETYDWMASSGVLTPEENLAVRSKYSKAARLLLKASWKVWTGNKGINGSLKVFGGMGVAALAFADPALPEYNVINELFGRSVHAEKKGRDGYGQPNIIEAMVPPDGSYVEGPDYVYYGFDEVVPLMHALRHAGYDAFQYRDAKGHRRIHNMWNLALKMTMPNRYHPNFCDSNPYYVKFIGELIGVYEDSGVYRWYADQVGGARNHGALSSLLFCDDTVKPTHPGTVAGWGRTSLSFPGGGSYYPAIFRSDWSRDATYLGLLGKAWQANGHGQADNSSFVIYAKNTYMAIDCGDGRNYGWRAPKTHPYRSRGWTHARGHNLILVDGKAPLNKLPGRHRFPPDPTYLREHLTTGFIDFASVETCYHYPGMNWDQVRFKRKKVTPKVDASRHVLFPNLSYFIIYDDLKSGAAHDYDWLLHFGGRREEGKLEIRGNDVTWQMDNYNLVQKGMSIPDGKKGRVELRAFFAVPAGVTITEHVGGTNLKGHADLFDHTYIKAHVKGQSAKYLCVLYPRRLSEPEAKIEKVAENSVRGAKIEVSGRTDYVSLGGGIGPAKGSRGELIFASVVENGRPGGGRLDYFMVKNGTAFRFNGKPVWSSAKPVTAALRFRGGRLVGKVCGKKGEGEPFEARAQTSGL